MLAQAVHQTWEPFVLVLGLLLIGDVASNDGLFETAGSRLSRVPGGSVSLFVATMLLCAIVTATLNLDTSVVFLTPVLLHTARSRSIDEKPFLYGSIFMANAASLLLLGSNLTNILVFSGSGVRGSTFAHHMLTPWFLSVVLTTLVVLVWCRRELWAKLGAHASSHPKFVAGPGLLGVIAATVLMLVSSRPALAVLAVALVVCVFDAVRRRGVRLADFWRSANVPVVIGLFLVATGVSVVSRHWHIAPHLLGSAGSWETAGVGALGANLINNLPAAALMSAKFPAHPYSLLLGLNLGPNLTLFGALSSVLWLRVAKREGARPSVWTFTMVGVVVTAFTLVAGLLTV